MYIGSQQLVLEFCYLAYLLLFVWMGVGFALRASCLLGRYSTA
jgi:hypothetical protein